MGECLQPDRSERSDCAGVHREQDNPSRHQYRAPGYHLTGRGLSKPGNNIKYMFIIFGKLSQVFFAKIPKFAIYKSTNHSLVVLFK